MRLRLDGSITVSMLLTLTGLVGPPAVRAQATAVRPAPDPVTTRLTFLSRERAARWFRTTPVIHCGPAPLTERPTASAEFARPGVVPLEAAFQDAATVKHTVAARVRSPLVPIE